MLGKFFASFSKAQAAVGAEDGVRKAVPAVACRRRLHLLYLLNDLLHHTKYHMHDSSLFSAFSDAIQPFVLDLIQLAAAKDRPKIRTRIDILLQVWQTEAYFSRDHVEKLRETVNNSVMAGADEVSPNAADFPGKILDTKEQPYVMPPSHGDPSTPYHDLPAGNLMPHIMPNKSVPIRTDDVRALQFVAGPADETLVIALKDFMTVVAGIDNGAVDVRDDQATIEDIDDLGQHLVCDEAGQLVTGRTYYGWSRDFCEKMKRRGGEKGARGGRERSDSSSRSRSRSTRKRRRYSSSVSRRSTSFSRSPSRDGMPYSSFRNGRRDYSSLERERQKNRSRTRSRSYSPNLGPRLATTEAPTAGANAPHYQTPSQNIRPSVYPTPQAVPSPPSFLPPHMGLNQLGFQPPPMGPGGLPVPPPPPANYSGPWPPPPPPLPSNMAFSSEPGMQPHHTFHGFPRPPPYQGGQHHYGTSGSNRWQQ